MGTIPSATSRPATIFSSTLNSNSAFDFDRRLDRPGEGCRRGGDFGFDFDLLLVTGHERFTLPIQSRR
jgi:hypothetical protein